MLKLKFETMYNMTCEDLVTENQELFDTVANLGAKMVKSGYTDQPLIKMVHDWDEDVYKPFEFENRVHVFEFETDRPQAVITFIRLLNDMDHQVELIEE